MAHFGLGGHLALVLPGVSFLHVADHQRPGARLPVVPRGEALVCDERVPIHRQDVRVAASDPRNLPNERHKYIVLGLNIPKIWLKYKLLS